MTAPAVAIAPTTGRSVFRLVIDGVDVSRGISEHVLAVEYTDYRKEQSDECSITVHNRDGNWTRGWYPTKGDVLELEIGWAGDPLLPCGRFQLDELDRSLTPNTLTFKGLA